MTTTTTPALSDLLAAPPSSSPGAWDRLLDDLSADDRTALEAAMRDKHMPTNHILRAIKAAGHRLGSCTLYEVRRAYLRGER